MIRTSRAAFLAALALLLAAGVACKKEESARTEAPPALTPAEVEAKLAAADAQDGTTDKVISGCLMCGLRMEGSADFTSAHAGYTLHF